MGEGERVQLLVTVLPCFLCPTDSKEHMGGASPAGPVGPCVPGPGWGSGRPALCRTGECWGKAGDHRLDTICGSRALSPVPRPLLDLSPSHSFRQEKAHSLLPLLVVLQNLSKSLLNQAGLTDTLLRAGSGLGYLP